MGMVALLKKTIYIPPNTSIDFRRFNLPPDPDCLFPPVKGYCLFDALDVYDVELQKYLIAEFVKTCSSTNTNDYTDCDEGETWIPHLGECRPNCMTDYDCPEGECIGSVCMDIEDLQCDENCDCLEGYECVNGICIPRPNGNVCDPQDGNCQCPAGLACLNGFCVWPVELCDFEVNVVGGQGTNTYEVYHELSSGTDIRFKYNTLNRPDRIVITENGVVLFDSDCVSTLPGSTTDGWDEVIFTIGNSNTISIVVTPCQSGSRYHIIAECLDGFSNDQPQSDSRNMKDSSLSASIDMTLVPNPFNSQLSLFVKDVELAFEGQVEFYDNLGRMVFDKEYSFEIGSNNFDISGIESLVDGVYIVLIKEEGRIVSSNKVIKVK